MVDLDMMACMAASEFFQYEGGKTVNDQQQQPNKPHGHDVANAWPFPTQSKPLKPWTPKEVKDYEKLQHQNAQEAPL